MDYNKLEKETRSCSTLCDAMDCSLQYSCLETLQGQRCLAGYSLWGHKQSNTTEWLSTKHKLIKQSLQWQLLRPVVCLPEQTNIIVTNVFFSILIRKESQKLQFTWTDNSVHPPSCRLGAVLIPLPSVIVLPEEPSTNVLQIITLFHYIDDAMLIAPCEQEAASFLDASEKHMFQKKIKFRKI